MIANVRNLKRGAALALCCTTLSLTVGAQRVCMGGTMDEAQQVPSTGSPATGNTTWIVDTQNNRATYFVEFSGLVAAQTAAHLHGFAPPGGGGPILINLGLGSPAIGVWNYAQPQESQFIAGQTYVNIHSSAHPMGEIRGQVVIDSTPTDCFAGDIDGDQEVPPVPGGGTGSAEFVIDTATNRLMYHITIGGLTSPETAAHIHRGTAGNNGPVLFNLGIGATKTGVWNYPESEEANILSGGTYVNIHTQMHGSGESRGQILPLGNPQSYCDSKMNSQGCLPSTSSTGTPSLSGADDFFVEGNMVLNNKPGIYFFGFGPNSLPFQGGTLCVAPPTRRTAPSNSAGNPPPDDCSGQYSFHVSQAFMASEGLAAGDVVYGQFWSRDPAHPDGTTVGFTNGIMFVVQP